MIDEYWDEKETLYLDDYDLWTYWLHQYFNELLLYESIESDYLTWKSTQHRLTLKYYIMRSLVPLVKRYFLTIEEDNTILKITCQR